MNILLFSPIPSHPHYHGHRKRIYNLSMYLKNLGHDIHFVYFNENPLKDCDLLAMQEEWETFTLIPRTKRLSLRHGNYEFDEWYQEDISLHVKSIIELFSIDVVWMNYVWQSKLLETLPTEILKIIDTHDKFTDRYKLLGDNGQNTYTWFSCSKEDEGKYLDRADIVVSIQKEEEKYFSAITNANVYTVGHIEKEHTSQKVYNNLETIGFLGAHNHINETSINDFLNAFYTYSQHTDEIQICIAGTVCNSISLRHKNLRLLGLIENLDDFYASVDLIINPLLFGTGLKIKSAEALAYGAPIVSSVIGFEGLESNCVYHQSFDSKEMVNLIDKIYKNPSELSMLATLSKNIFKDYEKNIISTIKTILELNTAKEYKEDKTILKLYKILQEERIHSITTKGDEYLTLMKNIKNIASYSTLRHPFKKFKAYKKMMQNYNFFRRL